MDLLAPLALLAGTTPSRAAVNAGFHAYARRRMHELDRLSPVARQAATLPALTRKASRTRFGIDHQFERIGSIAEFQSRVPLRTYEDLWEDYLKDSYPVYEDLTWPGRIPFLALTSGTTTGETKYIPVSHEMVASNRKAAKTLIAAHLFARPDSRLFHGRLFFLGGSSALDSPAPGVAQGDLSGIATATVGPFLRPFTFPPREIGLEPDWDRKLSWMVERSVEQPITLVSGVSSCLLTLFQRLLQRTGKANVAEVWPTLELVVHGGVKFDPYRESFATLLGSSTIRLQESYPCSEGFIAFSNSKSDQLRLQTDHRIFFEFVPLEELGSAKPTRHWLGTAETGVNYAIVISTCAGMWAHVIGDTIRFDSLSPPLLTFTGRTKYTLSAFGEHLISEEIEGAVAVAAAGAAASIREWHVGPVFRDPLGHHQFVVEFLSPPTSLSAFRNLLDEELARRNAHYRWFRAKGGGLPLPALVISGGDGFDDWMRSRGKLGGQHKVPRIDNSGALTAQLLAFLRTQGRVADELQERNEPRAM